MPHPRVRLAPTDADIPRRVLQALRDRFAAVRAELGLSLDYPADALAEAEQVAAAPPDLPDARRDRPALLHRRPAGLDGPRPGDAPRARRRRAPRPLRHRRRAGLRAPRRRARPGHPRARPDRLLPRRARAAAPARCSPRAPRACCRSRAPRLRLGPAARRRGAARRRPRSTGRWCAASSGSTTRRCRRRSTPAPTTSASCCCEEIGERRIAQERARGGASLPMPEQQVTARDGGGFTLEFRPPVPAEEWNAQVSLLTGMAAATMMLDAGVGVLRTMPAADARRRSTGSGGRRAALGAEWPEDVPYGEFVRGLDRTEPAAPRPHPRGDRAVPRRRLHRRSTASCPSSASTRRSPRPTPTSPRRCAGSSTASASSSARPRCRGAEVPDAVRAALPDAARADARLRPAGPGPPSGPAPTPRRRRCCSAARGESFGAIVVDHTDKGMEVQLVDLPVIARVTGPTGRPGAARAGAARRRRRAGR